jgi:hypothetical protein
MPPDMTMRSASDSVSLEARLGTKPMAPRSMARMTSLGAVAGRDDDHRQRRVGGTELGEDVEAVGVAERQVEQHQVEVGLRLERVARGARAGGAHDGDVVAQALDDRLQRRQDQRVVVDQQHFHRCPPSENAGRDRTERPATVTLPQARSDGAMSCLYA